MNKNLVKGSCLCGAVQYEAGPDFRVMVHCHCLRCRKGSGTAHATNLVVDSGNFYWLTGTELISRFDLPVAKSFGKWFCRSMRLAGAAPVPWRHACDDPRGFARRRASHQADGSHFLEFAAALGLLLRRSAHA